MPRSFSFAAGVLVLGIALGTNPAHAEKCGEVPSADWVKGESICLATFTYNNQADGSASGLVVFLHGDISRGGAAKYHAPYAAEIAEAGGDGTVAVALVRPGYPAGDGRVSGGSSNGRKDHYTEGNIASVADAVRRLRAHYNAARVVIVGHSGGAAMAGVLMGKHPGVADAAVLISCPCDIDRWRSGRRPWSASLSPSDFVSTVSKGARIVAITGAKDTNTRWSLAKAYIGDLTDAGGTGEAIRVDGAGHSLRSSFWKNGEITRRVLDLLRD